MTDEQAVHELKRALEKIEIMEHALGNKTFYRNHYACGEGQDSYELVKELVDAGFMVQGNPIPEYGQTKMHYFHVTEKGKVLAFHGARQ